MEIISFVKYLISNLIVDSNYHFEIYYDKNFSGFIMAGLELKIHSRDIDTLIKLINKNELDVDLDVIKQAYDLANEAHKDEKRLSGEPYIIHPLEVAIILADFNLDTDTIVAAILHDTVEDTNTTLKIISEKFNEDVAQLVDGVTKISSIKNRSKATAQVETLRKMLIATIKDIRVIIIKLADKLHNMRTIMFQPPDKQQRISLETLDIYAPIARRLGMSKISSELEDLAFIVLHPDDYSSIKANISQRKNELVEYLDNVSNILTNKFNELPIKTKISGRAKHYYSIYKKINEQNKSIDEIYDIRAIRLITEEIKDCYAILGIVHTLWTPIAARFKDFIAVPKSNMYQSLHTTVIGPEGHWLEVQIRTKKMHATAEMGIAAHWIYKDDPSRNKIDYKDLALLKNIKEWQSDLEDTKEFMKSLKMDLYENEIFVFTPKGKIINLPQGATSVDFAYAIHTEIGNTTIGSKVNNKIVPLRTQLNSGDIIEILTSKKGHPSDSWLKFVKSPNARYKIRNQLRKLNEENIKTPSNEKEKNEKIKNDKTIKVSIPKDEQQRLKKLSKRENIGISIDGATDIMIKLSQCCQPIPGDDVIGFITRGRGVTVHKRKCPSLKRLNNEKERFINIVWESVKNITYPIKMAVEAIDRPNLLKDIADEISLSDTNMIRIEAHMEGSEIAIFKFVLEVRGNEHMNKVIVKLKKIKSVTDVYKLNEKVILK